jgi:hypothetical protein
MTPDARGIPEDLSAPVRVGPLTGRDSRAADADAPTTEPATRTAQAGRRRIAPVATVRAGGARAAAGPIGMASG